jgi:hypothetical protein
VRPDRKRDVGRSRSESRQRTAVPLAGSRRIGLVVTGRRWLLLLLAFSVAAGLTVWTLWPSTPPPPRARQYLAVTACLLTDERGLAGGPVAPVWAGMQDASLTTGVKVQYLPTLGASTASDASAYLASLVQRHCDLIVAVGQAQVAAVGADASRYRNARFVAVGSVPPGKNVTVVVESSPARTRARVSALVRAAAGR